MANSSINCFMNVALQSLIACPAFFNMLTAVSESREHYKQLTETKEILRKFVELSRYFEPRLQMTQNTAQYKTNVVDAQQIFWMELQNLNPNNEQFDTAEFLTLMLDWLHEELKDIYISNELPEVTQAVSSKKMKSAVMEEWNETAQQNQRVVKDEVNQYKYQHSIVSDIFGALMREELHILGARSTKVKYSPSFTLCLDIPRDGCSVEECMDEYFKPQNISDYKVNGKNVNQTLKILFEKLPNVLIINFKRFIFKEKLIKKKEHVTFSDILVIDDKYVSPMLQMGIFRKTSQSGGNRRYRLFSVVEHVGHYAHKGHYVCYTLDSDNQWVHFDDKKVHQRDLSYIYHSVQPYMLFYELIQEE